MESARVHHTLFPSLLYRPRVTSFEAVYDPRCISNNIVDPLHPRQYYASIMDWLSTARKLSIYGKLCGVFGGCAYHKSEGAAGSQLCKGTTVNDAISFDDK